MRFIEIKILKLDFIGWYQTKIANIFLILILFNPFEFYFTFSLDISFDIGTFAPSHLN